MRKLKDLLSPYCSVPGTTHYAPEIQIKTSDCSCPERANILIEKDNTKGGRGNAVWR